MPANRHFCCLIRRWTTSRGPIPCDTAPGDGHAIFEYDRFDELEVNGERLVDWVRRLIQGEPVDDVHCEKCRVG
jgi:hypothetical protein